MNYFFIFGLILISCGSFTVAQPFFEGCSSHIQHCAAEYLVSEEGLNLTCQAVKATYYCLISGSSEDNIKSCAGSIGRFMLVLSSHVPSCKVENLWLSNCTSKFKECVGRVTGDLGESIQRYNLDNYEVFDSSTEPVAKKGSDKWVCKLLSHFDNCYMLENEPQCPPREQEKIRVIFESLSEQPFTCDLAPSTCKDMVSVCVSQTPATCGAVEDVVRCIIGHHNSWACSMRIIYFVLKYVTQHKCQLGNVLSEGCGQSDEIASCINNLFSSVIKRESPTTLCRRVSQTRSCLEPHIHECKWFIKDRVIALINLTASMLKCPKPPTPQGLACMEKYHVCLGKAHSMGLNLTSCRGYDVVFKCLPLSCPQTATIFGRSYCRSASIVTQNCTQSNPYHCLSTYRKSITDAYKHMNNAKKCQVKNMLMKCLYGTLNSCPSEVQQFFSNINITLGNNCSTSHDLNKTCIDAKGVEHWNNSSWEEDCFRCTCRSGSVVCYKDNNCGRRHYCMQYMNGDKWKIGCNNCICLWGKVKCTNYTCSGNTSMPHDKCREWHHECLNRVFPQGWTHDMLEKKNSNFCSSFTDLFNCMSPSAINKKHGCPHLIMYLLNMTQTCLYTPLVHRVECPQIATCINNALLAITNSSNNGNSISSICQSVGDFDLCILKSHNSCKNGPNWLAKSFFMHMMKNFHCDKHLPCHHGVPVEMPNGMVKCQCHEAWMGVSCSVQMNHCFFNPCKYGSKCAPYYRNTWQQTFECKCDQNNAGAFCQFNNSCLSSPCYNLGVCHHSHINEGFHCSCKPGTMGRRCEYKSGCVLSCGNGKCVKDVQTEKEYCFCNMGWTGEKCESDINECEDGVCTPAAKNCINTMGSYLCECANGTSKLSCPENCSEIGVQSCMKKFHNDLNLSLQSHKICDTVRKVRMCANPFLSGCQENTEFVRKFHQSLAYFNHIPFSCLISYPGEDTWCESRVVKECLSSYDHSFIAAANENNIYKTCILRKLFYGCLHKYTKGCKGDEPFLLKANNYLATTEKKCGKLNVGKRYCGLHHLNVCYNKYIKVIMDAMSHYRNLCGLVSGLMQCVRPHVIGCDPLAMNRRNDVVRKVMGIISKTSMAPYSCHVPVPENIRPSCNHSEIRKCAFNNAGHLFAVVEYDHLSNSAGYVMGHNYTSTCNSIERYYHCVLPHILSCPQQDYQRIKHIMMEYGKPVYNCRFMKG